MARLVLALVGALVPAAVFLVAATRTADGFRLHARFRGVGGCLSQVIGPGATAGSERLYASHIYRAGALDLVAIDPLTGKAEVFTSPIATEIGAWALTVAMDGQAYLGTLPHAYVLRLDRKERRLVSCGRPSRTEEYIWQFAVGTDKRLYGCTYPQAKLVRFDPATGKGEDLGRMHPREQYARTVAADDAGFVYTGIGPAARHIVAYEIATGEHRDILPTQFAGPGWGSVERGDDGRVYATAGDQRFRLEGWTATPISPGDARPPKPLRLADGRLVTYQNRTIGLRNATTGDVVTRAVEYAGKDLDLFRIGLGPDGRLYGSTYIPIHFFQADPDGDACVELGQPGSGEFYSFLPYKDALIGAAYCGDAPIMVYRPGKPYAPDTKPTGNPWLIHFAGENSGWRPMALIAGHDGKVYIGAVSGYGLLGGPLCVLDPDTGRVDQYLHLVKDQSVIALAALADGRIVGGTTVGGGGGSHPTATEARLFIWDPARREKVFETTPVSQERSIDALAVGRDGLVYGFAGSMLFVFDPQAAKVVETARHGVGRVIYNAVGPGPDGELYGVASDGLFTIDTQSHRARLFATYPGGVTGGFAIRGRRIYFTSGAQIVSCPLP